MNENSQQETNEVLDFNKPDFVFIPKGLHTWKQQGPYLVCKTCDIYHGSWIGMEKVMVGVTEKGEPILKKRTDI